MVEARRRPRLRQADRGVARPGNARPVATAKRARARHPAISRWSRQGVARRALRSSAPSARVFVITHLLAIRIAGDVDHGAHPLNNYLPSPNAKFLNLELEIGVGN